jgi:hypothetical protein
MTESWHTERKLPGIDILGIPLRILADHRRWTAGVAEVVPAWTENGVMLVQLAVTSSCSSVPALTAQFSTKNAAALASALRQIAEGLEAGTIKFPT